jgi:pimeloyl-ACP methyl ester carboxylesterase
MKHTTVNGVQLAYHDQGTGLPLLLVHAFPLNSAMWRPQLEALSARYRVIAPDLRGFGASELGRDAISLDLYADDLAALLDQLGAERVAFCGLSMGGYIAFAFLRRYRERIRTLILADTRAQPDTEEGRRNREQMARTAEEQGPGAIADQMLPRLLSPSAPEALRAEVRQIIEANDRRGIAAALRAMAARPDSTPLLATIDVPTLVIVGTEDVPTPPDDAQRMRGAIPNSRLIEIPGAGHLTNLEQPDVFNAAVDEFLSPALAYGAGGGGGGPW